MDLKLAHKKQQLLITELIVTNNYNITNYMHN